MGLERQGFRMGSERWERGAGRHRLGEPESGIGPLWRVGVSLQRYLRKPSSPAGSPEAEITSEGSMFCHACHIQQIQKI